MALPLFGSTLTFYRTSDNFLFMMKRSDQTLHILSETLFFLDGGIIIHFTPTLNSSGAILLFFLLCDYQCCSSKIP